MTQSTLRFFSVCFVVLGGPGVHWKVVQNMILCYTGFKIIHRRDRGDCRENNLITKKDWIHQKIIKQANQDFSAMKNILRSQRPLR